jgi:peptide methionine sulfoxide reductase MsrA
VAHRANHAETVKIIYDNDIIPLAKFLEHFLRIVDPYSLNRQGHDVGIQYRSGVYYENDEDKKIINPILKNKMRISPDCLPSR